MKSSLCLWAWGLSFPLCLAVTGSPLTPQTQQHVLGNTVLPARPFLPGSHAQTGFVALGDSYSAGIGTGLEGKEDACRRGLHAHPRLIAADLAAGRGGPNATSFQFLSCTGATTEEVLSTAGPGGGSNGSGHGQIDAFNASLPADFALLSLGGNDLGFFGVMNACVFRFYGPYSGTCEEELARARGGVEGPAFGERLALVVAEVLGRARREGGRRRRRRPRFSVTVTGYARFFNDRTDACDEASLGVWRGGPRLEKSLRLRMNALISAVNAKIRLTVDEVNARFSREGARDRVFFVDYDEAFGGHRFCEEDVAEPDYDRGDTWFFLVGGPDNARNGTQPKHSVEVETVPPTSVLVDPSSCLEPAQRSGDWGELALCYMAMAKDRNPSLRPARGDLISPKSVGYKSKTCALVSIIINYYFICFINQVVYHITIMVHSSALLILGVADVVCPNILWEDLSPPQPRA